MAIKPILFNTEMVRAILDGRKTQTRRLVKAKGWYVNDIPRWAEEDSHPYWFAVSNDHSATVISIDPPYDIGDILWVRETWCNLPVSPGGHARPMRGMYYYKADEPDIRPEAWRGNWSPSIHMPKEAARIFLRVEDVRAERLWEITEDDAMAEGATPEPPFISIPYIHGFASLWDGTVKKCELSRYGWEANPWVWVIEFERTEQNTPF